MYKATRDPAKRQSLSGVLNTKRQLYLSTAESLLPAVKDDLTTNDLLVLASESKALLNLDKAFSYYKDALDKAAPDAVSDIISKAPAAATIPPTLQQITI